MSNTDPLPTLWLRLRSMFARAVEALGDAASIAVLPVLTPEARRRIIAWLCPLEHIVRKLLLAEAAALYRAEADCTKGAVRIEYVPLRGMALHGEKRSARPPAAQCTSERNVNAFAPPEAARSNLQRPETWRAAFSFALPRDPLAVRDSHAPRIRALWEEAPRQKERGSSDPHSVSAQTSGSEDSCSCTALRLARRFEALRRVLQDPAPHAARLVRILARAVRRVPHIVRRAVMAQARTGDYDPADPQLSLQATAHAASAPDAFTDSS